MTCLLRVSFAWVATALAISVYGSFSGVFGGSFKSIFGGYEAAAGVEVVPDSLTFEGRVFSLKELKSAWLFGMNTTNRLLIVSKQNPQSANWIQKINSARKKNTSVRVTISTKENLVTAVD